MRSHMMTLLKRHITIGMAVFIGGFLLGIGSLGAETAELEKFIRSRIEIGETMISYMKQQGPLDRSPENLRRMDEDIEMRIRGVLKNHDLTVEEYERRSPEIFSDEDAVNEFLQAHPDLEERYRVIPHPRKEGHGPS